jgi:hypothetical protein
VIFIEPPVLDWSMHQSSGTMLAGGAARSGEEAVLNCDELGRARVGSARFLHL